MTDNQNRMLFGAVVWVSCVLAALILPIRDALARGESYAVSNAAYQAECGTCHVAYPPALLPATSWQAILATLDRHFMTDATVDAKSLAEIRRFLEEHAARVPQRAAAQPVLRITETRWFRHEHREVPAAIWVDPTVKTAANCAACHIGAERGDYRERGIRVPKHGDPRS